MGHVETTRKHQQLNGFAQHGVVFEREQGDQAGGKCPWCEKSLKFWVDPKTRLWDCKVCGVHGNWEQFLEHAHVEDRKRLKGSVTKPLTKDRGLSAQTFRAFGFGWNGKEYTYPIRDMKKVIDLRRYRPGKRGLSTKGGKISGFVGPEKRLDSKRLWVCEGEWDALALYEVLRKVGIKEDVYAVPGASNFPKNMLPIFESKEVVLCFDNDGPGQKGMTKTWDMLGGTAGKRVRLVWPDDGLPDGYDLRDLYHDANRDCQKMHKSLMKLLTDEAPVDSSGAKVADARSDTQDDIDPKGKGMAPAKVYKEFQKWLVMESPEVLDVMFGSLFANRIDADPFWIFFVAPAGGSKSEFLMTLDHAPLCHLESGLTPHSLISGMNIQGRDPSLIPRIIGKTLIVKDVTTILQMPQVHRDEIFGQLRDAYDGRCGKSFGNGVTRAYEGTFGVIGGVTPAIDKPVYAESIMGERFVKYRLRMKGKITKGKKACRRVLDNLTKKRGMREELMEISKRVIDRPVEPEDYPDMPSDFKDRLVDLAQWVANMRGFVSRDKYRRTVDMKPTAEVGTRLAGQLGILAMGIGIYHNMKVLDDYVYRIITKVARDTAPPTAEGMVRALYVNRHKDEATTQEMAEWTSLPSSTCLYALQDLAMLDVLRHDPRASTWRFNPNMLKVMDKLRLYDTERGWEKSR